MDFLNQDFVENFTFRLTLSRHSVSRGKRDANTKTKQKEFYTKLKCTLPYLTLQILFEITQGGREGVGGRQ